MKEHVSENGEFSPYFNKIKVKLIDYIFFFDFLIISTLLLLVTICICRFTYGQLHSLFVSELKVKAFILASLHSPGFSRYFFSVRLCPNRLQSIISF